MPKGKQIGNTFERKVVKLILKAVGSRFSKKDCFRVPMSGAHQHLSSADIEISKRLLKVVPFAIECKHRKTFKPVQFFQPTEEIYSYIDQVVSAATKEKKIPLVVAMGARTQIFAIFKIKDAPSLPSRYSRLLQAPGYEFLYKKERWKGLLFTHVLKSIRRTVDDLSSC